MIATLFQLATDSTTVVKEQEPYLQITLAVITLIGLAITGWLGYKTSVNAKSAATESAQANHAVNHKEESEDRLFDMVAQTRDQVRGIIEWKRDWDNLPEQFNSVEALAAQFKVIDDRIITATDALSRHMERIDQNNAVENSKLNSRLDGLEVKLITHIDWEESQKYPEIREKILSVEGKLSEHQPEPLKQSITKGSRSRVDHKKEG